MLKARLQQRMVNFKTGAVLMLGLVAGAGLLPAQRFDAYRSRGESPAGRTAHDLEFLARGSATFNSGRERGRYDNAIRHLSQFQNTLYKGHFDKDRLDQAIGDVQHIVDHNPLDDRARGMLWRDLEDLRAFRANRGYGSGRPW